jgi:2-polyprenyl-6-methoxyphenol hydroxylase-like FAD-dependent oxidoreductase
MRVLVIGAGVGGLTLTTALRRNGIEATVFEKAPELSRIQVGGGIHIWPNAIKALRQVGLGDQVEAIGMKVERVIFRSDRGKSLGHLEVGEPTRRMGAQVMGTRRALLHRALADSVEEDWLVLGTELTRFEQDADGVTAHFADGRQERGDALIGADGITSVVRAQLLGEEKPRYSGYSSWIATTPVSRELVDVPDNDLTVTFGPHGRFVFYHVAPGQLGWIANLNRPEGERDNGGAKERLLEAYRDWAEPIGTLISNTENEAIIRTDLVDRRPVKRWGEGRATLLGDAAHPMTPNITQGACQAMVGAVVLTKLLRDTDDVEAALRRYEEERIPYVGPIQKRARMVGALGQFDSRFMCWGRNWVLKTFGRKMAKGDEKLWAHEV